MSLIVSVFPKYWLRKRWLLERPKRLASEHLSAISVFRSSWFRQCLELLNTLIAERSSEARRFGRSSNHLFRSQYFGKYWNYETHIFLSKCSKFNVGLIKAIKIAQKIFCFWDNAVWSCCCKFIIFRREYLSSAANVLKNGPKLSILTKADVFQLYLSHINEKIR